MNAETDDTVRLQRAWRSLSLAAVPQATCPDPERLWDAVRGELGPGDVRQVIDHTATCGACAEAWRLAREIAPAAEEAADRRRSPLRAAVHSRWRVASWGAMAAAAMVLLVVGLQWRDGFDPAAGGDTASLESPPVFRGAETAVIRSLVPSEATLPRQDFVLRWEGPEGARYDLWVNTDDLMAVTEASDLDAPEYRVPEADLAAVAPGSRLLWRLEARLSDGGTARSATFVVLVE